MVEHPGDLSRIIDLELAATVDEILLDDIWVAPGRVMDRAPWNAWKL